MLNGFYLQTENYLSWTENKKFRIKCKKLNSIVFQIYF